LDLRAANRLPQPQFPLADSPPPPAYWPPPPPFLGDCAPLLFRADLLGVTPLGCTSLFVNRPPPFYFFFSSTRVLQGKNATFSSDNQWFSSATPRPPPDFDTPQALLGCFSAFALLSTSCKSPPTIIALFLSISLSVLASFVIRRGSIFLEAASQPSVLIPAPLMTSYSDLPDGPLSPLLCFLLPESFSLAERLHPPSPLNAMFFSQAPVRRPGSFYHFFSYICTPFFRSAKPVI